LLPLSFADDFRIEAADYRIISTLFSLATTLFSGQLIRLPMRYEGHFAI